MELYGIDVEIKNIPPLEQDFIPTMAWNEAYLEQASESLVISVSASPQQCMVYHTKIRNTATSTEADHFYVDHLVKTLLWLYGGHRITITGSKSIYDYVKAAYAPTGHRAFDADFMSKCYKKIFKVESTPITPKTIKKTKFLPRELNGHRIGLDIGGNSRKVAAISNGKVVYTEEVLWNPIEQTNPDYHYRGIMESVMAATRKLPRVDAIGISSAGIYIDNEARVASLFRGLSKDDFDMKMRNLYSRIADNMGVECFCVENGGDVAALAGAMNLDANNVLGIAMNTSEAVGYIDPEGCLTGWLNELAFVPVDLCPTAHKDEWSGVSGCGGSYFSQVAALRLCEKAGIRFPEDNSDTDNIRALLIKAEQGEPRSKQVFQTMGVFLGHTLAFYHSFYHFDCVLLLGRVMSGAGGDMMFNAAQKVLAEEYPTVASSIMISLPDENDRRIVQSVAAASLPEC